ncbi:hypothetical protein D5R95_05685 [Methanosalsum natronophilum]|uniref:Transmembrane protein n=1 Tax=Methanosalsum natronophilum TaxID=768733 RepID=A0A424YWU4_9EURY|nr:MAG: hypothetical protein D5R95_05685 [Methanosalsum natronophilum]
MPANMDVPHCPATPPDPILDRSRGGEERHQRHGCHLFSFYRGDVSGGGLAERVVVFLVRAAVAVFWFGFSAFVLYPRNPCNGACSGA